MGGFPPLFFLGLMIMAFFSTTLTPTTAVQKVMANKADLRRVTQVEISVRSMGTATYVGVGGRDSQDKRLTAAKDSVSMDTPLGKKYLNLDTVFVISDTADAVLEIFGDSWEGVL